MKSPLRRLSGSAIRKADRLIKSGKYRPARKSILRALRENAAIQGEQAL